MQRFLLAATLFALLSTSVAMAQDPPAPATRPTQPKANPFQPAQPALPGQPFPGRPTPVTTLLRYEEELETLEALQVTKNAYVRAAELGVKAAEINLVRIERLVAGAVATKEEAEKARLEILVAKAQYEIRVAEMKEVEVKIKFAKKRLEDSKARSRNPAKIDPEPIPSPKSDPNRVDTRPTDPVADLKKQIAELEAVVAEKKTSAVKAEVDSKLAATELARILDVAKRGRVIAGTIEKAEAKAKEAQVAAEQAQAELKKSEAKLAEAKAKLKEIEK